MLEHRQGIEQQGWLFLFSAFLFRVALATMTFDQIRPFGILARLFFLVIASVAFVWQGPALTEITRVRRTGCWGANSVRDIVVRY